MYKAVITSGDNTYTNDQAGSLSEISNWISEISNWLTSKGRGFTLEGPIDLSKDDEYKEKIRLEKIKSESPSLEEKIDAIILSKRGDDSKLIEVIKKIEEVEQKYTEVKGI